MSRIGHLPNQAAGPLAVLAAVAVAVAAAQPVRAEQDVGSPKWAADQFRQIGLKPAAGAHGFLSSVRAAGGAGRSAQVVGVAPGADPLLARDYVLVTGRLDAPGEAAMLDVVRAVTGTAARPRRTVVFVLSAAEGADRRTLVPSERIVADISLDALAEPGAAGLALRAADETSLGRDADELASAVGLDAVRVAADPQVYGALSAGVPTLSIGLDAVPAERFSAYLAALITRVAGRDERPAWAPGSRFAPPAPRAAEVLTDPVHMPLGRRPQPVSQAYG